MSYATRLALTTFALLGSASLGSASLGNAQTAPAHAMPMTMPTTGAMPMSDMGKMAPMMQMMRGSHMMPGMQSDHIEGRIAYMKAELAITDAQMPQWTALTNVMRANAQGMREGMAKMMQVGMPSTAPARADAMVQMMSMHLDGMKSMANAGKPLYAVLTDAQKKIADDMMSGPMGRM